MPLIGSSGAKTEAILEGSANKTTYNLSAPLANTEYSQSLPNGTKILSIKVRGLAANAQWAFVSGQSGTLFETIPRTCAYKESGLNLIGKTLYIQTDQDGQIVEICAWF